MTNNECSGWLDGFLDNLDVADTNPCEKCCESCENATVDSSNGIDLECVKESLLEQLIYADSHGELEVRLHEDEDDETIEYLFGNDVLSPLYLSSGAILPAISDVKMFKNQTVVVFFADGTKEHAILHPGDTFSLEQGISICLTKRLLDSFSPIEGKGSAMYNKLIDYALDIYKRNIEAKAEAKAAVKAAKKAKVEQRNKERELRKKAELEAENERDDLIDTIALSIVRANEIMSANEKAASEEFVEGFDY